MRTILGKAKHALKVVCVPGNHDELLRDFHEMTFGNVHIIEEAIHTNVDGRRLLVTHGDKFDSVVRCSRALALLEPGSMTGCSKPIMSSTEYGGDSTFRIGHWRDF